MILLHVCGVTANLWEIGLMLQRKGEKQQGSPTNNSCWLVSELLTDKGLPWREQQWCRHPSWGTEVFNSIKDKKVFRERSERSFLLLLAWPLLQCLLRPWLDKIHFLSTMLEPGGQAGLRQNSLVLSPHPQNGGHCSEDGLGNGIYIFGAMTSKSQHFSTCKQGWAVYRYVVVSRYWIDTVPVYICTSVIPETGYRLYRDITI